MLGVSQQIITLQMATLNAKAAVTRVATAGASLSYAMFLAFKMLRVLTAESLRDTLSEAVEKACNNKPVHQINVQSSKMDPACSKKSACGSKPNFEMWS
jgi:hypothetical protein